MTIDIQSIFLTVAIFYLFVFYFIKVEPRANMSNCLIGGTILLIIQALISLAVGDRENSVTSIISAIILLIDWLRRRRKDIKRIAKQLGAKSRKRIQDLVDSMPRPVLRPIPQEA
jgi:hypothetical protein